MTALSPSCSVACTGSMTLGPIIEIETSKPKSNARMDNIL